MASACRLQVSLSCAVLCHIVSLQCLSISSLHRLTGLHCRPFSSFGIQVVTLEVHRSSLRQWICPVQDHFIFLTLLIISMTFVLSPLVFSHSLCRCRLLSLGCPYVHVFQDFYVHTFYVLFLQWCRNCLIFVLSQMTSRNPRTQHLHSWHLIWQISIQLFTHYSQRIKLFYYTLNYLSKN